MSRLGDDFPRDRFVRTPITVIRWALREIDNYQQEQANISAVTTARLVATVVQVAHAFSGSKRPPPKLSVTDFLPYPDWKEPEASTEGPDDYTRLLLVQLSRQGAIPGHVMTALLTPLSSGT